MLGANATLNETAETEGSVEKRTQDLLNSIGKVVRGGQSLPVAGPPEGEAGPSLHSGGPRVQENGQGPAAKRPRLDNLDPFKVTKNRSYKAGEYVILNPWGESAETKMLAITTLPRRETPENMVWISLLSDTGATGCPSMVPVENLLKIKHKPGDKIPVKMGWKGFEMTAYVRSARLQRGKICYEIGLSGSTFWVTEEDLG